MSSEKVSMCLLEFMTLHHSSKCRTNPSRPEIWKICGSTSKVARLTVQSGQNSVRVFTLLKTIKLVLPSTESLILIVNYLCWELNLNYRPWGPFRYRRKLSSLISALCKQLKIKRKSTTTLVNTKAIPTVYRCMKSHLWRTNENKSFIVAAQPYSPPIWSHYLVHHTKAKMKNVAPSHQTWVVARLRHRALLRLVSINTRSSVWHLSSRRLRIPTCWHSLNFLTSNE